MPKKGLIIAMVVGAVILITIIAISVHASAGDDTRDLKLVHIIFRHGIRTPADTYPKDPYINDTFYPTGWGQITNQGKLQLYQHGKFLRERYGKFLGTYYSSDKYYVQATDVDRTKVTAQCINSGLWPPQEDQKWGPLDWQPIPVHSEPLDTDNLLLVRRPCAQYNLELEKLEKTPEIEERLQRYVKTFEEVEKHTGKKIKTFEDAQDVFTTLMAEEAFNKTLPEWTKDYYPDKLYEPTVFAYILNAYNDKLNRLKGGVFLKKLISDWNSTVDGTLKPKDRKAFLYIGHDSTIVNILSALKVWDPQIPGFAINVLMEFSQDTITKEYGLELFLRNSTSDATPIQLQIPNCEKFCPLTRLIELTEPVIPQNWEEECKSDDPNYTAPPPGGP